MMIFKIIGTIIMTSVLALQALEAQTNSPVESIMLEQNLGVSRCYVGEAVPLSVTWCVQPPIGFFKSVDIHLSVMESEEFKAYDSHKAIDQPNSKSLGLPVSGTRSIANLSLVKRQGHNYTALQVKKVVVPQSSGRHVIDAATMTCFMDKNARVQPVKRGRAQGAGSLYQYPLYFDNNFFDKEISQSDIRMTASSSNCVIDVLPLPQPEPALFSGLVGQYDFSVSLSTNRLRQGDPLIVSLSIASDGYLEHVKIAPLEQQDGFTNNFRVVDNRRLKSINKDRIVFTQTVYPIHAGDQPFPSIVLPYFNTTTTNYSISTSNPIELFVSKSKVVDGSELFEPKASIEQETRSWWWKLLLAIAVVSFAIMVIRKKRSEVPEEVPIDISVAYREFKDAVRLLKESTFTNSGDQHSALNGVLGVYFSAHLVDHRPGAITYSDVYQLLAKENADATLIKKTRDLFSQIDLCRFSPAGSATSYKSTVDLAHDVILALQ